MNETFSPLYLPFVIFFNFSINRLGKQNTVYCAHPSKKYIYNGQHSIRHFEFLSPWNRAINYCWRSLRVCYSSFFISHPWLICHCFSGKLGLVNILILSIGSQYPFPLLFTYFSNYNPENNLTPALLQIEIYMQFGFFQQYALIQDLADRKELEAILLKFQQISLLKVAGLIVLVSSHQLHGCEVVVTMGIAANVWFATCWILKSVVQ